MPRSKPGVPASSPPTKERDQVDSGSPPAGGNAMGSKSRFALAEGNRFRADIDTIAINPRNLREEWEFETAEFREFEDNLEAVGEIQDPVVARLTTYLDKYPTLADKFEERHDFVLIAGERRFRAAQNRGARTLDVVLKDALVEKGDLALLSENQWRKNFDPIQEGMVYARLADEESLTYAQIAARLGGDGERKVSDISKRVRLARSLKGDARKAVRTGDLKIEPAYLLLSKLKDPGKIDEAYRLMLQEGISAKEIVERLVPATKTTEREDAGGGGDPAPGEGVGPEDDPGQKRNDGPGKPPARKESVPLPAQKREGSPAPSKRDIPEENESGGVQDADSFPTARCADDAGRKLLSLRMGTDPAVGKARLSAHIVRDVTDVDLGWAATFLGFDDDGAELRDRLLEAGNEKALLLTAEVLVMLADDRELNRCLDGGFLSVRAAEYLTHLRESGYEPTPQEATATYISIEGDPHGTP